MLTSFLCFLLVTSFAFLASTRQIGVVGSDDAIAYYWYYDFLNNVGIRVFFSEVTFEPFFTALYFFSSFWVSTEQEMLFFFSMLCNALFFIAIYNKKSRCRSVFALFLILSNTSLLFYETQLIRQTLSLAFFVLALSSNKYKKMFVFLSVFTHFSAVLFFFFLFVGKKILSINRSYRVVGFCACVAVIYLTLTFLFGWFISSLGGAGSIIANKALYYNDISQGALNYKLVFIVSSPVIFFVGLGAKGSKFEHSLIFLYVGCVVTTLGSSVVPQVSERFFVVCLILFPLVMLYLLLNYLKLDKYLQYSACLGMFTLFLYKLFFSIMSSKTGFSLLNGELSGSVF
ncbi:EpsG family protein [Agarivorans sp. 1_MG-2023]|uniref:EpsG family protein n=1 Tax=Agarivorans sp. 1_MG-2023 TaxID=3062634 RepID=UPI0026E358D6|nr:EpsG family protein [Agarivorans sp. 1_MG-2023]MDO6764806.1 EpsG family protein [Agarivorans sp. 1_MG-2023]